MQNGYRTSHPLSPWLRIMMPSIADVIFVGLLGALLFTSLSVRLLGDAGIGWHIRTGQIILATHHVPRVDPFSSTMRGQAWFAWEWLYDVIVGEADSTMGLNGVVWFNSLIIALVFGAVFQWMVRRAMSVMAALALTLLAISASMIHFLARPHVVTWLFTLAWFVILDATEREALRGTPRHSHWLWLLPPAMLLWVNMHGGFVLGFVLLGIYLLAACWTWWRTKRGRLEDDLTRIAAASRARQLLRISFLCVVVGCINPYGWTLYWHVYSYLSNRFLMSHIQEFQSPDFHGWAQRCFLALLLIAIVAIAVRGRRLRTSELLIVLFSIYSGLYAARNIPAASILLVAILGPLLCAGRSTRFSGRIGVMQSSLRGHVWPIAATVLTLAIAANAGRLGKSTLIDAHFDPHRMPVAAVDSIEAHGLHGPILSTDFWGGYLIYRLYPKDQVVLDDRHDLYGESFLKSYLKMFRGEDGWQEFLQAHPADSLLFPRDAAITNLLLQDHDWKALRQDDVSVIFIRDAVRPE